MPLNATPAYDTFATHVVAWQKRYGRHELPWQQTCDPYRIWLSEIMLQQTQVSTVIGYYQRFLERFPSVQALAKADQDEVMPYWAGLGYYARARNLHRCAQELCTKWGGEFPRDPKQIATLPGIGRSTAAAIAAFSWGERSPIMDGNVKRVFTRYFGIYGQPNLTATENTLWKTADTVLEHAPAQLDMTAYTQGLMDLGSTRCTRGKPDCINCPLKATCYAQAMSVQHELPVRKTKKVVPERHCAMLILTNKNKILLEQQPSPGIWGGLWSLPKYDDADNLRIACTHMGQTTHHAQKMASMLHVFSHFKLHIEPWLILCETPVVTQTNPDRSWVNLDQLSQMALPAPVKKLLEGLYPEHLNADLI
ncbi:A/G-specific adenine glycosylase [Alcaligenaceae bacterium]|nr:A/G-specific adenine glycosylase [Alcaligenaceae bacterium]